MTMRRSDLETKDFLEKKRTEMICLLEEMADVDAQNRLWLAHGDYPVSSGIDEVFHFIFDDTDLGDDAISEVGRILKNEEEAESIKKVASALNRMLASLGDKNSAAYLSDPMWPDVVALSKSALNTFRSMP